jgi:glycosyltransferase 2 family protein
MQSLSHSASSPRREARTAIGQAEAVEKFIVWGKRLGIRTRLENGPAVGASGCCATSGSCFAEVTDRAIPGWRRALRRVLHSVWFKAGVAALIVYALVHYNRLDWRDLRALGATWPWLALGFSLMFPPFLIVAYRLQVILRSQDINVSYVQAFRWNMIGSFFDLAMPSSNGGDLVKAGLIANHVDVGMRTRAVMAVAFDRVLGLVGLFLLAAIVGTAGWSLARDVPGRHVLLMTSVAGSLGVLLALRILGSRRLFHSEPFSAFVEKRKWGALLRKLVGSFNQLRERPSHLFAALALSIANHVFWCASLICIARAVGNAVPLVEGFVVFPLAIFGNIFGVSGGFGIGTAGFDLLLSLFLGIKNGALIGLLFQSLGAVCKLAGLPFYLSLNRAHAIPRIEES